MIHDFSKSLCGFLSTLGEFSIHEPMGQHGFPSASFSEWPRTSAQFAAEKMATLKKVLGGYAPWVSMGVPQKLVDLLESLTMELGVPP